MHGTWPPAAFKVLDDDAKTKFYQEARAVSSSVALKQLCDDLIVTKTRDSFETSEAGEYLPLSVYKRRGFSTKRIKAKCLDYKEDDILGRCYRLKIKGSLDTHGESQERIQKVSVVDGAVAAPAAAAGGAGGAKLTQDERDRLKASKATTREEIRQAKAMATQQARSGKADKKECELALVKLVKASFNIRMASKGKNKDALELLKLMNAESKKCENFIAGKGALIDKRFTFTHFYIFTFLHLYILSCLFLSF
jgi:hypothetical protein